MSNEGLFGLMTRGMRPTALTAGRKPGSIKSRCHRTFAFSSLERIRRVDDAYGVAFIHHVLPLLRFRS